MDKQDTIDLIRSLAISRKGKYELRELLKDFRAETGYSLPSFGYKTPLDFLRSVPDTIKLEGNDQHILIKHVDSPKSSHISSLIKRENLYRRRKPFTDFNKQRSLKQIEEQKGNTPWKNGKNWKLQSQNNIMITKRDSQSDNYKPKCDYSVQDNRLRSNQLYSKKSVDSNEVIETKEKSEENDVIKSSIIKNLNDLPKLNLQNFVKIGKYVEVCISVIWTPHNFILQLRKYKIKLKNLMVEMQLFYNQNGDKYMIIDSTLNSGSLCAAFCKTNSDCSKWYRAIILEPRHGNDIIVGLIDYGMIIQTDVSNLRFLHRRFDKLPQQAISGHLANIRPVNGDFWSEESIDRFVNLAYQKELVAGIIDLDYEDNWLSVALSFTCGKDVHISDTLVDERLAVYDLSDPHSRICLPWIRHKELSKINKIPEFWFHSKQSVESKNRVSEEKDSTKSDISELFFSYSESNVRLLEMFVNYQ